MSVRRFVVCISQLTINLLCTGFIKSRKNMAYVPRYSTRDQWIQESLNGNIRFWAALGSQGCRENCRKYAIF